MFVRSLVYGILAHLIIGWAFFFWVPPRARETKRKLVPVTIQLTEKTASPSVEKAAPSQAPAPQAGKAAPSQAPAPQAPESNTARASKAPNPRTPVQYTDLLPKARDGQLVLPESSDGSHGALLPGQTFKPGTSGVIKQKLMVDASILSGALDVPLFARRISTGSEAFVRIVQPSPGRLKIVDLRGDPMLRAVMFENLQQPRIRALILELMQALEENSLPLTLQTRTTQSARLQDETDVSWIGRRLIIRKSAAPESRAPFGAISLPDEDAKKAVIRDRLEFERYQRSPAYRSAIQNFELPTEP